MGSRAKKPAADRVRGVVKQFFPDKGFGFLERCDDGSKVFIHVSQVRNGGTGYVVLEQGDTLEFRIEQATKGPAAIDADIITRAHVGREQPLTTD